MVGAVAGSSRFVVGFCNFWQLGLLVAEPRSRCFVIPLTWQYSFSLDRISKHSLPELDWP
jgi:hypothetical protein